MRLSIPTKIFIAFSGVILSFTVVLMIGIWRSQRLHAQSQALNQSVVPLSLLLSDAQNDIKSLEAALGEPDTERLGQTLRRATQISVAPRHASSKLVGARAMTTRRAFDLLAPSERAKIKEARERLDGLIAQANALDDNTRRLTQAALAAPGHVETARVAALKAQMRADVSRLDLGIARLRNDLRIAADLTLLRIQRREREHLYALGAMSAAALLISLALLAVSLRLVQPIRPLTEGVKRIAAGDYAPVALPQRTLLGKDELLSLSEEFNSMARALAARDEALARQHAALLRSERLATIGRMTSLITHEVRNPLSSIGLNAEMLQDSLKEVDLEQSGELLALLATITGEVDRLSDITEEYLIYARHPEPRTSREAIAPIIEHLLDFHLWEWDQRQVHVSFETAHPEAIAWIDPNQIRQALLNLVKNAVEASPAGAAVTITLRSTPEHHIIDVLDQGAGISPQTREQIFEPFFTDKTHGTGLGLPMTLQIIEQHGGDLQVSAREPEGSCFTIRLPALYDHDEPARSLPR